MVTSGQTASIAGFGGLYVLTPEIADTEMLTRDVDAALRGGARIVQYRNKIAAAALRLEQASALRELCSAARALFIINDDVELAATVRADGVHLGREDGSIAAARSKLGVDAVVGASCYDSLERAGSAVAAGASYVAFGSFFASRIKPSAVRADVSLITAAKARWDLPVVAIGGITVGNARPLIAAGVDALAVVSAVFDAPDICASARAFDDLFAARAVSARV